MWGFRKFVPLKCLVAPPTAACWCSRVNQWNEREESILSVVALASGQGVARCSLCGMLAFFVFVPISPLRPPYLPESTTRGKACLDSLFQRILAHRGGKGMAGFRMAGTHGHGSSHLCRPGTDMTFRDPPPWDLPPIGLSSSPKGTSIFRTLPRKDMCLNLNLRCLFCTLSSGFVYVLHSPRDCMVSKSSVACALLPLPAAWTLDACPSVPTLSPAPHQRCSQAPPPPPPSTQSSVF